MLSLHIVLSFLLVCLTFSRDECLCHKAELFWPSKHSTLLQSSIYSRRNKNNPQVPCRAHKKLCRNWLLLWLPVQSPINPGGPSHPMFLLGTKKNHLHFICSPSFFSGGAQPYCCGCQTPSDLVAVAEGLFL